MAVATQNHDTGEGALTAALANERGGFRANAPSPPARQTVNRLGKFAAGGLDEFHRLVVKTQFEGLTWTARDELRKDLEYVDDADSAAQSFLRAGQSGAHLVGAMLTITLAAAVGFVGTKVTSEIDSSIETQAGTNYDNASNSISSGFADAMGLTDIVFLVIMFGVILGTLLAFGGGR